VLALEEQEELEELVQVEELEHQTLWGTMAAK